MPNIPRIKAVAKKVLESNGKKSISQAMREEGYPDSTASNPQQLTKSKTWRELMDEFMAEDEVAKIHGQLLHSAHLAHYVFAAKMEKELIREIIEAVPGCKLIKIRTINDQSHAYYWAPDNKSRQAAIDMSYKLKGKYIKEQENANDPYETLADEELKRKKAELEKEVKLRYENARRNKKGNKKN